MTRKSNNNWNKKRDKDGGSLSKVCYYENHLWVAVWNNSKMSRFPYVIKDTYACMLYIKVVIILYILYCVNIIVHSLYTGMCDFYLYVFV